jgi:putative inorganic carbon (hco3(-)) transporter
MSEVIQAEQAPRLRNRSRVRRESIGFGMWLYCIFIVSYLLHFGSRVPPLGAIRIDLLLAGMALLAVLFSLGATAAGPGPWKSQPAKWLLILILYIVFTWPFVEWPGSVIRHGLEPFAKAIVFFILTIGLVRNQKQLLLLVLVMTGAQTFRVLEPLYLHLTDGYWGSTTSIGNWEMMDRLSGAPSDVVNPNGLAYIIVMTIPFLHFVVARVSKGLAVIYWILLPMFLYTLLLANSRSGFVVLLVTIGVVAWQSRSRVFVGLGLAAALIAGMASLSEVQVDRFRSIYSDSAAGAETAEGRIEGVRQDLMVAMRNPVVGHGLGTSREANAHGRGYGQISHNLYTEVAQELGFVGLAVFLMFLLKSWQAALAAIAISSRPENQLISNVSRAVMVTMIAGGVFGLASYGLSEFYWYLWAGLAVACLRLSGSVSPGVSPGGRPVVDL